KKGAHIYKKQRETMRGKWRTYMPDHTKVKSRRDFIKDGMRAVLLGGLVFSGLFLGLRGRENTRTDTSCSVDLPCRSCSKINKCRESSALQERKIHSENRSSK
ncbi:hypothetical protein ACFLRW_02770, partial [Acidobacteriota bacterium]